MQLPADPSSWGRHGWWLLVLLLVGCSRTPTLDDTYGRRRGTAGPSVNGTRVLADMFEQAGHRVSSWQRLSPKLDHDQVIVWFPDDMRPPGDEQRAYFEQWLMRQPGRTLVYVGRDYDAAIDYWRHMLSGAPADQATELRRRLALAQADQAVRRSGLPARQECAWFAWRHDRPLVRAGRLTGVWGRGLDASRAAVRLHTRLEPPGEGHGGASRAVKAGSPEPAVEEIDLFDDDQPDAEVLLGCEHGPLVIRLVSPYWHQSQLIIVANGSFLLNLPLVAHEHRKLAGRLINACGPAGRVVFLESQDGGPPLSDSDNPYPTGLEAFTVWPVNVVLLHLTALGLLVCFAMFPIFGRPRQLSAGAVSDFGKHVDALGQMLERTGDRAYAQQRLAFYHQLTRREAGPAVPAGTRSAPPAAAGGDSGLPGAEANRKQPPFPTEGGHSESPSVA